MKRLFATLVLLVVTAVSAPVHAADTNALAQLRAFASGLHSLSGHFQQTLVNANGQAVKTSSGTVALKAPQQFRWQTTAPYQQLIVADGSHVWMYEPDLEQVTVRQQTTAEANSPLTVLTDLDRLEKDYTTTELGTRDGLRWLRLKPKDAHAHLVYVELGFDGTVLRAMRFKDRVGNTTRIRFSDWQRNQPLPASTFTFTPPQGVDVIGDVHSVPQIHALQQ